MQGLERVEVWEDLHKERVLYIIILSCGMMEYMGNEGNVGVML